MVDRKPALVKAPPKPKKIMVVDDDPFCCQIVKMLLEGLGQEVELASNGKEGVNKYQKNCKGFKGILMDFHMPEMDGFEATKQIRKMEKYLGFNVPVVGLTGDDIQSNPRLGEEAQAAGMNYVLNKPVNQELLEQLIDDLNQ